MKTPRIRLAHTLMGLGWLLSSSAAAGPLAQLEFIGPGLVPDTANLDARAVAGTLVNREALDRFFEAYGASTPVFLDPRSGAATNVILHVPLIPGTGVGNRIGFEEIGARLGRPVERIDAAVVGDLVRDFIVKNREAIGIDASQLGATKASSVTDELWQVSIPQEVDGIRVRRGRIAATISHGNLVLLGTERWGIVAIDTKPTVTAGEALEAAARFVGGWRSGDRIWRRPALEIVPVSISGFDVAQVSAATIGCGLGHRLVWAMGLERPGEGGQWEMLVDARDARVLAFQDTLQRESRRISGGVYPDSGTGVCTTPGRCGVMQPGWPMPYADTGLPAPNDYTDGAGVYEFTEVHAATTTLAGRYVRVLDGCGALLETSEAGNIDLGGVNGQHDCGSAGTSPGDTAAARTGYYELNEMFEIGRGWLPTNPWLHGGSITFLPNAGAGLSCNGYYSTADDVVATYRSGNGCMNYGEFSGVHSHEWGHALDNHDAIGEMSLSSEGYADIAALYRHQTTCNTYGIRAQFNQGCGLTLDGTGNNKNESQIEGTFHCDLDCSAGREQDWNMHADHVPDTPQNFVLVFCDSGGGPCGTEMHCGAAPTFQAGWDFAARDLVGAPYNLERNDAFVVASRIFYQGSGNIGEWHSCDRVTATSDGCAATSGYMQWLAADDDNGNLIDGTPHMVALDAAFARHNIACDLVFPVDSGCAGRPTTAPILVAAGAGDRVDLSWTAVPGATRYRVLRAQGHDSCAKGKTVVAEVPGLGFTDTEVANGIAYGYSVQPVGTSGSCAGPSSTCESATPLQCAGAISTSRIAMRCGETLGIHLDDSDLAGAGSQVVSVRSTSEQTPETLVLTEVTAGSGRFSGTIPTTSDPPAGGDGRLSTTDGDTITIGYLDASRCGASAVPVERTIRVDCRGPATTAVRAEDVTGESATIRWQTDEPGDSRVSYGATIPPPLTGGPDAALVTSHAVPLIGLAECTRYRYSVRSVDLVGNVTSDDNQGGYYSFTTLPNSTPTLVSPDVPLPIPGFDVVNGALATFVVSDGDVIEDLDVLLRIESALEEYLLLRLIGPDGTTVVLANRRGYEVGYDGTRFDDEAAVSILQAEPPFAGSFRPEQALTAFDGKISTGVWTLQAVNAYVAAPPGALTTAEIRFTHPPHACGPAIDLASEASVDDCTGSGAGGGDDTIDPGETVDISVQVTNHDPAPATGPRATLTSFTPGVFVTAASTHFPDLAPGGSAPGDTPHTIYVDSGVPCGTVAVLRLAGSSNEGGWRDAFTLRIGSPAPTMISYANDVPKTVPDLATTRSWIDIQDPGTATDVDLGLTITHGWAPDLDLYLVSPEGTRVELSTDNGGAFGQNYTDTVFDDEAGVPVQGSPAPFTGRFRPESPLSGVDGEAVDGTWTLEITDDHAGIQGTLVRWSLDVTRLAQYACNACTVSEPPLEVPTLAWSGTTRDTLVWSAAPRAATYEVVRGSVPIYPICWDRASTRASGWSRPS